MQVSGYPLTVSPLKMNRDARETAQVFSFLLDQVGEVQKLRISLAEAQSTLNEQDERPNTAYTPPMNNVNREEFNARLETIEVKMDARVESVSGKIDAFMAVQAERDKRMEATLNQISTNHSDIKSSIGSMKTTMIVTAISTVLAIVIGIAGFNAMLTSNMISSFQMGRSEKALALPENQKIEPVAPSKPPAALK